MRERVVVKGFTTEHGRCRGSYDPRKDVEVNEVVEAKAE